uniref:M23ase beta-sheet core domain-containing protein n=1 Tax=Magnetococcus massalia (strain MO-1) TaxID=451514 RepID=A0A1S7LEU4_MAGMO|nr:protein of unknown function[Include Peptidase M23 domain] [Candidatus Magnetococcus massalia]
MPGAGADEGRFPDTLRSKESHEVAEHFGIDSNRFKAAQDAFVKSHKELAKVEDDLRGVKRGDVNHELWGQLAWSGPGGAREQVALEMAVNPLSTEGGAPLSAGTNGRMNNFHQVEQPIERAKATPPPKRHVERARATPTPKHHVERAKATPAPKRHAPPQFHNIFADGKAAKIRAHDDYAVISDGSFGSIRKQGDKKYPHKGVDLVGKIGDRVYAPFNGTLKLKGNMYPDQSGLRYWNIESDTGHQARVAYMRLNEDLEVGDRVQGGQTVLGTMGNLKNHYKNPIRKMTPHIHLELRDPLYKNETGRPGYHGYKILDPTPHLWK